MEQTEAMRKMWAAGDYVTFGDLFAEVGRALVDEIGVDGLHVLDVATGTGNTAIAAAEAGAARVAGQDITPELLRSARERSETRGLNIEWGEGDMRNLVYPDGSFDRVLSTFGAMGAPEPALMAAELLRVCRPGGAVASTAWSPEAGFSKVGDVVSRFLPQPDGGSAPAHDPADWARPEKVPAFFADLPVELSLLERSIDVKWESAEDAATMITTRCGPLTGAVSALKESGRWPEAYAALTEMLAAQSKDGTGSLTIEMPYLLTIARPA
ncbi:MULTISPECIES: class I SAM-dependent methyltransferase [Thermomonosporaceae]|uniref:class I SAM-dependent methyltransferase n=1 Tax=Thermomonosporaceae TaxID=2012 RepID=UPI00255AFFBB|nr:MULTISPECIES: class I SAM-dependent methyltransferase [Thermomonosporaceae]MDL4776698.1 class I SAM-dependent methyltransferase [Actinomadura xylanilytica]